MSYTIAFEAAVTKEMHYSRGLYSLHKKSCETLAEALARVPEYAPSVGKSDWECPDLKAEFKQEYDLGPRYDFAIAGVSISFNDKEKAIADGIAEQCIEPIKGSLPAAYWTKAHWGLF